MKISFFLILATSFFGLCLSRPCIDTEKLIRTLQYIEDNEESFESVKREMDSMAVLDDESLVETLKVEAWTFLDSDEKFFFALRSAIQRNSKAFLEGILCWTSLFRVEDFEIDFFLLLALPKSSTSHESATEMTEFLFNFDIRTNDKNQEDATGVMKIGTFSVQSLRLYLLYLWSHPEEITSGYQLYSHYIHSEKIPGLSTKIRIFDLVIGAITPNDFYGHGPEPLRALTHLKLDFLEEDVSVLDRLTSVFELFIAELDDIDEKLESVQNLNLTFAPLKRAFFIKNNADEYLEESIYESLLKILFDESKGYPDVSTMNLRFREILILNTLGYEPEEVYELAQNLIVRFLALVVADHKDFHSGYVPLLWNIPLVIKEILANLGTSPDWQLDSRLAANPDLFNTDGTMNMMSFWILAHFPSLMNSLKQPLAVSSQTFQRIVSNSLLLLPTTLQDGDTRSSFQERLFGVFNVKSEFKLMLKNAKSNWARICHFANIFRIESDFRLISSLSVEERKRRIVVIKNENVDDSCSYTVALVFRRELKDNNTEIDHDKPLTLLAKIILSIH